MITNVEDNNIRGYSKRLSCSEKVYDLITVDCVNEYLTHHPELVGLKIPQNMILHKIVIFYLGKK